MNYFRRERGAFVRISLLILCFMLMVFIFNKYLEGKNQYLNQMNRNFLESYTNQKINCLQQVFYEGKGSAQILAYTYESLVHSMGLNKYVLHELEKRGDFDYVRYIDLMGKSYTAKGQAFDVSDRNYYKEGIEGKSGIDFVPESKINGKRLICFYSPIYKFGKIEGVLACFYDISVVEKSLGGQFYGYDAKCIVIDEDQNVLMTSGLGYLGEDLSHLMSKYDVEGDKNQIVEDTIVTQTMHFFEFAKDGEKSIACITRLGDTGWYMIQGFPHEAIQALIEESDTRSFAMITRIAAIFLIYILFIAAFYMFSYKIREKAMRETEYIYKGTGRVFSKFILLDFTVDEYEFLHTRPTNLAVEKKGTFDELLEYIDKIIIDEKDKEAFRIAFEPNRLKQKLEKDDRVFTYNLHVMNPGEYWDTISIIAVEWSEGKVVKALVTNQHVTEMKKKEERDRIVLKEALASAQEANKAKSEFLSSMSHDIRTPMNAIVGFAQLLNKDAENPKKVREYTRKISAASNHLLGLINDILDMSKIESGKVVLNISEFDCRETTNELLDMIRPQMEEKHKQFTVVVHDISYIYLKADIIRVNQIILNLLSNAIKYTNENGNIELEIYQNKLLSSSKFINVTFVVKDDGIGMENEFKSHIFESFTREISSLTNKIQGTGLGMAISKNLVDLMNGTITVESEKNKGSIFTVTIPMEIVEKEVEEVVEEINDESVEDVLNGMKFLVAEDNEVNYMVISSLLEMKGASSVQAINGQDAVLAFKKSCKDDFDMIFMDIQMPVMNGYEATKAIRQLDDPRAATIPIIAMTANAYAEDVSNALNAGMNAHIAKPIDMNLLMSTVKKLKK